MSQNQKELRELLAWVFDLQDAIAASLADDGKITRADLKNFLQPGLSISAAFENLGNPVERFRELPKTERKELIEFAFERFDLPDDQLEEVVKDTLRVAEFAVRTTAKWQAYSRKGAASA